MKRSVLGGQRLVAVFLLGTLLLNFPLLAAFDTGRLVAGIPLIHLYVFGVWAGLIGLLAWFAERTPD